MLDPVTSLGLASNIIQLVDFGAKCIKNAREIAENGCTEEQSRLRVIISDLVSVANDIEKQKSNAQLTNLAAETQHVAQELSQLLEKVKIDDQDPRKPRLGKRKRSVAKQVIYSAWKRNDINKLEQDLSHLRQQLMLRLSTLQRQSLSDVLSQLHTCDQRSVLLARYEKRLEDMQAQDIGSTASEAGPGEAINVLSRLKELADQGHTITKCQQILKSLGSQDLRSREQMITQAHESTFEWIFQEKRLGFAEWAAHENGIFWVTGKPGSGKSTLMKYLVGHSRTYELLRQWAGSNRLGVASHYFWNPGTAIQKSELGLLRKLLYDIVRQFPAEALEVIPAEFQDTGLFGDVFWTVADLRKALEAFGKNENLSTKFCFFIDGLDEYHSDHEDLVKCLSKLARCPSLKLCVSSRPWNVFNRAYNNRVQGQLAVQELTRDDIKKFIDDRMNASEVFRALQTTSPRECAEILTEICEKAQGVFLWVHLVVRSLLRGLHNNDDSVDILRQRVQEYPDTLDGYFDRMFRRIEKVYRKQSARILLVALATQGSLPLRTPFYIEQEIRNPHYARDMPKLHAYGYGKKQTKSKGQPLAGEENSMAQSSAMRGSNSWEPLEEDTPEVGLSEVERSRRYIDARCGDLLEVNEGAIVFLHRTARDFLDRDDMQKTMRKLAADSFDAHLSVARARLAQVKRTRKYELSHSTSILIQVVRMESDISDENKLLYADILEDIGKLIDTQLAKDHSDTGSSQAKVRELIRRVRGRLQSSIVGD